MTRALNRFAFGRRLAPGFFVTITLVLSLAVVGVGLLPNATQAQTAAQQAQHARDMNDIASTVQAPNGNQKKKNLSDTLTCARRNQATQRSPIMSIQDLHG